MQLPPTINETTYYDPSQVNETHLPQPHSEYPHPPHLPFSRAPPIKLKPQSTGVPPSMLQSRLRQPASYPPHLPQQPHHNSSTLPPIHHHTSTVMSEGHGMVVGNSSRDTGGQAPGPQTLTKLPNIHGRSKTYAGRTNKLG